MRSRVSSLAFAALTVLAAAPLWVVARPPSQDWPQHVAAVRVLASYDQPGAWLDAILVDLTRTQYLGFYLLAAALSRLTTAGFSVKLLTSLALVAVPHGVRALLRETGGDERYALFALALSYNAHLVLGFLSFFAAVPVALFALVAAARYRRAPGLGIGGALSLCLVCLFFLHVVPLAFALIGVAVVLAGCRGRALLGGLGATAPSLLLALYWALSSSAGESTLDVVRGMWARGGTQVTRFTPLSTTARELPIWLTDVLPGEVDLYLLLAACVVLLVGGLALRAPAGARAERAPRSVRMLAVMPLFALACGLLLPSQHRWIWPIAGRFPYLALLLAPLLLPRMRARGGALCAAALAALAVAHLGLITLTFRRVEHDESRGFERALAAIPEGSSVIGLMYAPASKHVSHNVFMHSQAYAQAERGGICMFSFAETPQSPFIYRTPPFGPPRIDLGLGWVPQNADMARASSYFEFALARGDHPHLFHVRQFYEPVLEENGWSLYRRRAR